MRKPTFIKWIGILLLIVIFARVFLTPGVKHRHADGERFHTHGEEHAHPAAPHSHPHSHRHPHKKAPTAEPPSESSADRSHIHISFFGWELTVWSAGGEEESPVTLDASIDDWHPGADGEVVVTPANMPQTLIQLLFDLRSPQPPARVRLLGGGFSADLPAESASGYAKDREQPPLPPPECCAATLC